MPVALFMGAWIEIGTGVGGYGNVVVALFMGAWIEIGINEVATSTSEVALFMGAWIEIGSGSGLGSGSTPSHSLWVRGLKSGVTTTKFVPPSSRTLYGCVD